MLAAINLERVDERLYKSKIDGRKLAHLGVAATAHSLAAVDGAEWQHGNIAAAPPQLGQVVKNNQNS